MAVTFRTMIIKHGPLYKLSPDVKINCDGRLPIFIDFRFYLYTIRSCFGRTRDDLYVFKEWCVTVKSVEDVLTMN